MICGILLGSETVSVGGFCESLHGDQGLRFPVTPGPLG